MRERKVSTSPPGREHVGTVACDVGGAPGHDLSQMVLGDDLDGEMILKDVDIGVGLHGLDETLLNLIAGVVGVVKNPELAVSTLAVEVKGAIFLLIEVHAPLYELFDL